MLTFYHRLKNPLRVHEENTKKNHNLVVSLHVIKARVTLSWISLQIFLNIFRLRKQKLPNLPKELAYKTFRFLSRSKNSQYVLHRILNSRPPHRVLYPIKHSCSFFKHSIRNDQQCHSRRSLWIFCSHFFETVPRPFGPPKSLQPVNCSLLNKDLIYEMRCWLNKTAISWKVFGRFSFYENWLKREGKW